MNMNSCCLIASWGERRVCSESLADWEVMITIGSGEGGKRKIEINIIRVLVRRCLAREWQ